MKLVTVLGTLALLAPLTSEAATKKADAPWTMNATAIEACSCPMFCQCYFNTKPAGHGEHAEHEHGANGAGAEHFCRFNNAYKVNRGHYGTTKLDGGKTAEVQLDASTLSRDSKSAPMVLKNLKYWGSARNDGFVLMPNTVEALRTGDKPYEFQGTNGFMITFDVSPSTHGSQGGM